MPSSPNDPFFSWKKVGKAYVTDKAKSPKAAPMMANSTGIWLPAKGYFVSINASTKVCTKVEASKLATAVKLSLPPGRRRPPRRPQSRPRSCRAAPGRAPPCLVVHASP